MNSLSIKKGDNVVVIAGKDNKKTGEVLAVSPKTNRVIVKGVNVVKKHKKARNTQQKSEIISMEAPISASNVMVVCTACNKATRIAHAEVAGKKVRVCKHCGATLDKEFKKTAKKEAKKAAKTEKVEKVAKTKKTAEKVEKVEKVEPKTTKKSTTTTKKSTGTTKKTTKKVAESK